MKSRRFNFVRNFFVFFFTEKNIGGIQMPPSSEVLKSGFKMFLQKVVEVLLSKQNGKYRDRFLDHFLNLSEKS